MRKKSVLLCFLIVALCPILKAAVSPSKYLTAIDFDDSNWGLLWALDADFNAYAGRQLALVDDKACVFDADNNAIITFYGVLGESGYVVKEEGAYVSFNYQEPWGWALTSDNKGHLVLVFNQNRKGYDYMKSFEVFTKDGYNANKLASIKPTPEQLAEIHEKVGAFRYIFAYGDLSNSGYIVACGGKSELLDTSFGGKYKVTQTNCMVKFEIQNYKITQIKYYNDPLFFDNAIIYPINENEVLVNSSLMDENGNVSKFVYQTYCFDLKEGKGGWGPEIVLPSDIRMGGIRKTAVGGCYVNIQDCKVYFYSTGARHGNVDSNEYKFSQFFTGFDYTAYDPEAENPIKNCYYYKNYREFIKEMTNTPAAGVFANFILPYKVSDSEYFIFHYCPDGNYIGCYKLYAKSRGEAFGGPNKMDLIPKVIKSTYDIDDLQAEVVWDAPVFNSTDPNKRGTRTLLGYELELWEFGTDKPVTKVNLDVNTLNYTFTGLKPHENQPTNIVADTPTTGMYTVKLRARYEWRNKYKDQEGNENELVYEFYSEDAVRECQPDYLPSGLEQVKAKTIWVPESPFPGGVTPARAYTVVDFDAPKTLAECPVSYYNVYAERNGEFTLIEKVPGTFDFNNKKNVSEFGNLPDGMSNNYPYVAVHEILDVPDQHAADNLNYIYYVETVYADQSPAARKTSRQKALVSKGVITGVENTISDNSVSVSPTLVNGIINVACSRSIDTVDIYSLSGTHVKHFEGAGNVYETIFVDDLASGTYFVKINESKVIKIIKK